MSFTIHHAIIVTSWDRGQLELTRDAAADLGLRPSPIMNSHVNSCHSFFIPPDGSKEHWAESDNGDERRGKFISMLLSYEDDDDGSSPFDWVVVRYGQEACVMVTDHTAGGETPR